MSLKSSAPTPFEPLLINGTAREPGVYRRHVPLETCDPPQRSEFDGRPRSFPSGAAPRPAKPGAMPIAHAPGFAVPSAVAVQEVAAVNVAFSSTMAAGVAHRAPE